ncbi:MAG TPA: glycosyltransferase family 1 protein [Gammaproteobacteria bacterium]|nr:glycosyltransferase family 1 protein [Gammaproteobacteria bacterium]
MESLNLCLAAPSFFPTYGGAQLRFLRYLPGLRARAIDTRIVTGTPTANEHTEAQHVEQWSGREVGAILESTTPDGTPVYRVRLPDEKGWKRVVLFNRTVVRYCNGPDFRADVLQLVTGLRPLTIPWIRYLRARGIAVAYAVTIAPKQGSSKVHKRLFREWSERLLYNQLDCIITNNSPLKDIVREMGITTRVEVIPNGVDLRRFHRPEGDEERDITRRQLGLSKEDFLVTTIGAVIPRKGGELLLEAWLRVVKRFPSAHLLFIGPRTDQQDPKLSEFRDRLQQLREASGVPGHIHFLGEVKDVDRYLRATELFVLPSEREGMPNSVLEAMASGVPVIVTPFVGLSDDLGQPGREFLLSGFDEQELALAISGLLGNPDLRCEIGNAGYRWVKSRMDLEIALDRYAAVYRELVGRYRSRRQRNTPRR